MSHHTMRASHLYRRLSSLTCGPTRAKQWTKEKIGADANVLRTCLVFSFYILDITGTAQVTEEPAEFTAFLTGLGQT